MLYAQYIMIAIAMPEVTHANIARMCMIIVLQLKSLLAFLHKLVELR